MFSRLTAVAAAFAVLTTASIAVAASRGSETVSSTPARAGAAAAIKTVELQRVVIVGKRVAG